MKLQFKVYSPFLFLLVLAMSLSCNRDRDRDTTISQRQKTLIEKLKAEQDAADTAYKYRSYDSAFSRYTKLRKEWLKVRDSARAGYVCCMMGQMYFMSGNYNESENLAVEALSYIVASRETTNLPSVYNLLGMLYRKHGDFENAIKNYKDALKYTKDSLEIPIAENNIASLYTDSGQYNKALEILLPLNKSKSVNVHLETKARVLDNIGAVYFKMNNVKALAYLEEGLEIRKTVTIEKEKGLISSYLNLSDFYQEKDKRLAGNYAMLAYSTASALKNNEKRLEALRAQLLASSGEISRLLMNKYMNLSDSVSIIKTRAGNSYAKIKYDYEEVNLKLKQEKIQSSLRKESDGRLKWLLGTIAFSVLLIAVFVIYILRIKHKKDKLVEIYNTESRISKKIHDELANDVFKVMSFAESDGVDYPGQQKLIQDLDVIYNKTRDISHENNTIDTGEKFGEVLRQMLADYNAGSITVVSSNFEKVNWNKIAAHKKIAVYRVLHELMVNMKKHSGAKLVVVKFNIESNNVTIQYTDNGSGFVAGQLILKNGLQNAENRISAIKGSLIFEPSTSGLRVYCTFPV